MIGNKSTVDIQGVQVQIVCFDGAELISAPSTTLDADIPAGGTAEFTVDVDTQQPCTSFAAAASGREAD